MQKRQYHSLTNMIAAGATDLGGKMQEIAIGIAIHHGRVNVILSASGRLVS
jgi:hypothetical protein